MRHARRLLVCVAWFGVFFGTTGCGAAPEPAAGSSPAGPRVMALDSVLLVEADTLYIGYPFGLAVDPFDGSFYVSDSFSRRVYRFRRDGTLAGTYGRPGRGPGEFTSHAQVAVVDDSTVATPGMNPPALYLFDRQDGRLRSTSPLPPVLLGTGQLVIRGGDLLMAARPLDGATSLLVWASFRLQPPAGPNPAGIRALPTGGGLLRDHARRRRGRGGE